MMRDRVQQFQLTSTRLTVYAFLNIPQHLTFDTTNNIRCLALRKNCKYYLYKLAPHFKQTVKDDGFTCKNCKYKFGLPKKTQTIINVLKSTHIQILTAINSLGPNYRRIQGLARGEGRPPSRQPA